MDRRVGVLLLTLITSLLVWQSAESYLFRPLRRRKQDEVDNNAEEGAESMDLEEPEGSPQPTQTSDGQFVLLALFDGIRGCSMALRALGAEPCADYSSEVEVNSQRLIAARFPECVQLGDVRKISKDVLQELVGKHGNDVPWLVVGGSPCQDLSRRKGTKGLGLQGKKSKLFFEFVRIVNTLLTLGSRVAFLLENVASMPDWDRDVISACLGIQPLEIDSVLVSACHRQRYYWTNLPVTSLEPQDIDIDALLDDGWCRIPKGKPFRCFVSSAVFQSRRSRGDFNGVCRKSDGLQRHPNADERETILGFPRGYTKLLDKTGNDLFSEGLRIKLLGNSFSVQVLTHLLAPIAGFVRGDAPLELRPLCPHAAVLTMNRAWGHCRVGDSADAEERAGELAATRADAAPTDTVSRQGKQMLAKWECAEKLDIRIRNYQRNGKLQREAWHTYCDRFLGGIRDPRSHSAKDLEQFLQQYAV